MPRDDGRRSDHDPRLRFEAVFRRHHPQVLAYAIRRSPEEAADVVSEVFLTAWRRLDDLPADALPWLLGVARRVIANMRRASTRRPSVPIADPATVADAGSSVIERVAVAEAFRGLSDADREVLMLVAWDGLPAARAARVLGCSVPAFHVRLHRARTRLTRALEGTEGRGKPSAMIQGDDG
jgi:RNA polymerase sigma-70 factor, ECF subfamily